MFGALFGNYLLQKGLISREDLTRILNDLDGLRLHLGVLAIDAGFMTADQVNEIHDMQETHDRHFGELATQKGYLTDDQLVALLLKQNTNTSFSPRL